MSNDVVPYQDIERMATAVAKSGLFNLKTTEQALALMIISQAEGRHPALAARDYDIIQGRPAKRAEAMMRDFLAGGGKVEWHRLDDECAEATFAHPAGGTYRCEWDMKRAVQAGLGGKEMWKKYPRQMLRSRCVSEGIRTVYPAATSGMYVEDEVRDMATERDITPPKSRRASVRDALKGTATGAILEAAASAPIIDSETGEVIGEIDTSPAAQIDAVCEQYGADPGRVWDWLGTQGYDRESATPEVADQVADKLRAKKERAA